MKIGGGAVIRAGLFDFSGRAFGVSIAEQFGTGDSERWLSRSFFQVRPNGCRGYPARVELHPSRLARLADARHLSHWLDLPVPRVLLALTARLLPHAAQWWHILALPGRRASF